MTLPELRIWLHTQIRRARFGQFPHDLNELDEMREGIR